MYDLIIDKGVINVKGEFRGKLAIKSGKIAAIFSEEAPSAEARRYIDAWTYSYARLVDTHVHCGHGTPEREILNALAKLLLWWYNHYSGYATI